MFDKKIIGICGLKGSGKSTLMKQIGGATNIHFAKALKQGLEAMGVPPEALYDPAMKNTPLSLLCNRSGRYAMVTLGTEWGRDMMGDDFWVRLWHKAIADCTALVIVVDDVRFAEEIVAIREYPNHQLVYVKLPNQPLYVAPPWWKFWVKKPHRSERLNPTEFGIPVLVNDSTPEALYQKFLDL